MSVGWNFYAHRAQARETESMPQRSYQPKHCLFPFIACLLISILSKLAAQVRHFLDEEAK